MPEIPINFGAVLVAALANMVVGSLWYGPLFGRRWKSLMGFTDETMKNMKMKAWSAMLGGLVTALLMAFILAHDTYVWGLFYGSTVGQLTFALEMGFFIWLGYVATVQAGSVLWEGKSWRLFLLNTGNSLVSLIAMSLVLTFWR